MTDPTKESTALGTRLNETLARWLDDEPLPKVDCGACRRFGKCCDFQPFVPGFLVGAWLEAGRAMPPESSRYARLPIGLVPTRAFRAARGERSGEATRADELCAFYEAGRCTIWAWRPGECSAFACVDEDHAFAARAFALETTLQQMALVEQGFAQSAIARQIDILNEPGEGLVDFVDVEPVYRASWAWLKTLDRADVAEWLEEI